MKKALTRPVCFTFLPAALVTLSFVPVAAGQSNASDEEALWFRNVRQLTFKEMGLDRAGEAYFSPDGKQITFLAYPAGKSDYQVYVMNVGGTGLKMVSTGEGATACPYFHSDGKRLLFSSNHLDQRLPDTSDELERFRPRGAQHDPGKSGHPGGHPGEKSESGHSGGERAAGQPGDPRHAGKPGYAWTYYPGMDIFEYTLATGDLRRLTTADGYDAEGSYSPDGRHILFSSFRDGDQEIYIADADGKNPRRITHVRGKDGGPFFSPDGTRICYRSDRLGNDMLQIFINNLDGTDERALTGNDLFNWCPFWHPSGQWLIFTRADFRGRPNFDLYLIRDDASEIYRVTYDQAFDGLPVFSPDGRYLMWTSRRNGLDTPQVFIAEFIGLTPEGKLRSSSQ